MPERGDSAEVRRRVLERAGALFQRRGLSAVTMDEIAASLGMSKKTLYQHFAGKEELAAAAMEQAFDELERDLALITADQGGDFGAQLQRYMAAVGERYRRLDGPLLDDIRRGHPAIHALFRRRAKAAVEKGFGRLFAAGVAAGELRADLDPAVVARMVQGLSAMMSAPDADAPPVPPSELFALAFDILLNGIRVRSRPGSEGKGSAAAR